ncbi:alpha/beta hydrolase [Actinacidiphila sp. DG2A-62]|uniref:alpha/beta hydrolase n=1 Tax=Actinacidiphila sp. DG2A-62 TaxID=3108821 RepID=UPI002DBA5F72|nr:alpha/beta hydrolase [Actinacidiphila sp. DG2A-62]MEC3998705.1 alpha/beta hydrolase [Actinacidiphila sp. DG2A-62]
MNAPVRTRAAAAVWRPAEGLSVRGTVVLLPGRGEHPGVYERFGRRLAVDAYEVRVLDVPADQDVEDTAAQVADAVGDAPAPVVLAGSDTGALHALSVAARPGTGVAALLLAATPAQVLPAPAAGVPVAGGAAGPDAADATGTLDAGPEASPDAGPYAGPYAGRYAGRGVSRDVSPAVAAGAGSAGGPHVSPEASPYAGRDVGLAVTGGAGSVGAPSVSPDAGPCAGRGVSRDVSPDAGSGMGPGLGDWQDELAARTACPVHRGRLDADARFVRGGLARPVPAALVRAAAGATPPDLPTLVVHGGADPVAPPAAARRLASGLPRARLATVAAGRHDVLNDLAHRSVAATVVLWLESLRAGPHLPPAVTVEDAPSPP